MDQNYLGHLVCGELQALEVRILVKQGTMIIKQIANDTQIAYLPAGSMDTILVWCTNGFQIQNPGSNVKADFVLSQMDTVRLKETLRGRQIYLRSANYQILQLIAPMIRIVNVDGMLHAEKFAMIPQYPEDFMIINRFAQLRQEADILIQLKEFPHPNLISMRELCTDGTEFSILLEYCPEGDLLHKLNAEMNLDVRTIMQGLLEGLRHLHHYEIVHRDIKLQNLLFQTKNPNSIKIADFGLSCHISQIMTYNPRCGTPGYTAPEVFREQSYTYAIDIYSAGLVFYNLLTKKNPFGKTIQDVTTRNMNGDYDQFHLVPIKNTNPRAFNLLQCMLEINPEQRYTATNCLKHPYFYNIEEEQFSNIHAKPIKVQTQRKAQMPKSEKKP